MPYSDRMRLGRLELLYKAGYVSRYHTHTLIRGQSVAEHTYGVLAILAVLTDFQVPNSLLLAALMHDVPEAVIGDMPSPIRRALTEAYGEGHALNRMEADVLRDNGMSFELSAEQERLLKLADMLEGLCYCQLEIARGNRSLQVVYDTYREYIEELELAPHEDRLFTVIIQKGTW